MGSVVTTVVVWWLFFLPIVLMSIPCGARVPHERYFFQTLGDIDYAEYWRCSDGRGIVAIALLEKLLEILDQHVFAVRHGRHDLSFVWRLAQVPLVSFFDRHFVTLATDELAEMLHLLNYPNHALARCDLLFQWRWLFQGVFGVCDIDVNSYFEPVSGSIPRPLWWVSGGLS